MNKKILIIGLILGLAVLIITIFTQNTPKNSELERKSIEINGKSLIVEVVDTPETRSKGLSGHKPLQNNEGMLFVFEKPGFYGFWMKDMTFAIDILWLDEDFKVVDAWLNASPGSYPKTYTPKNKAKYVLETNPGVISIEKFQPSL